VDRFGPFIAGIVEVEWQVPVLVWRYLLALVDLHAVQMRWLLGQVWQFGSEQRTTKLVDRSGPKVAGMSETEWQVFVKIRRYFEATVGLQRLQVR